MTLKKIEGNKMVLTHKSKNGKSKDINITTDAKGARFIKSNIDYIKFDSTNKQVRFVLEDGSKTTLTNVMANNVYGIEGSSRITFKDGNRFNISKSNLLS